MCMASTTSTTPIKAKLPTLPYTTQSLIIMSPFLTGPSRVHLSLGEESDHHLATAPGMERTSDGVDVALDIIVISTGRIDRDDLFDGGTGVAYKRDGDLPLDVAVCDELIPMRKTIFPGRHLSIPALVLVHTGAILDTALIAKGQRFSGFSRGTKPAFMEEEGQGIIRTDA